MKAKARRSDMTCQETKRISAQVRTHEQKELLLSKNEEKNLSTRIIELNKNSEKKCRDRQEVKRRIKKYEYELNKNTSGRVVAVRNESRV